MPRRLTIWLMTGVLLAGCGAEQGPAPRAASPSPFVVRSTPEVSSAAPTGTARPGKRRRVAGDFDGDGRADLIVHLFTSAGDTYDVIVPGSPRGLDPARRTVVTAKTSCVPSPENGRGVADLDGDGITDMLGFTWVKAAEGTQPCVLWGPYGIRNGEPWSLTWSALTRVPGVPKLGDFDGDGSADLAAASVRAAGGDTDLVIMYGPFRRDGTPARRTVQPSPTGSEFQRMTADTIKGRRATDLIVYEIDDGEQATGRLLRAGPGGLAKTGRRLPTGSACAFGDFDGDGARDLAVGDSGSRNNEPPYETEAPSVHHTVTVSYGNGRSATFRGTAGRAVAGDFDGDSYDDLAFGGGGPYEPFLPVRIYRGGPGGLRFDGEIGGAGEAGPRMSGDFDGDGDDELVLAQGRNQVEFFVTDGRRVLSRFTLSPG